MRTEWSPSVRAPRLLTNTVDVWRADLGEVDLGYDGLLSDDEQARAARIIRAETGRRWATSRGILRALLAQYLGADPRSLRFELGAYGKPALAGSGPQLRFNISHARDIALYAVALQCDVGVDVEHEERRVDDVRVARRIFGEVEAERLAALDPVVRRREFLRAWVRHEAVVKCLGTGIGGFRIEGGGDAPVAVTELHVGPRTLGAVAVSGPACAIRCWQWPVCRPDSRL